ncbi:hypothetical protein HIM_09305 [Hirsutella minnesotensis 3608]|uniref:FAD-binding domain-containing protein n=1 Tax=Hirsutella minnesotensis 3608 TaxID=1043627 RepID=A0A0F7ZLN7_9HYPO|nr:hypothetical protein HIM_09305 [Hirsutella minnesotensis 3608]
MSLEESPAASLQSLPDVDDRSPSNGISVLVVGSGIGGLSAARELWRIGCDVRVFEKQPSEVLTGDSFTIGPSAIGSLRKFPRLDREVSLLGCDPVMRIHNLQGALVRGPLEMKDILSAEVRNSIKCKIFRYSRPRLYQAMLTHLRRVGVPVDHGMDVIDYFENESGKKAGVVLQDGAKLDADLVIAADGIHSQSWKTVLDRQVPARPSGDAAFRVAYPIEVVHDDAMIGAEYPLLDGGRPQTLAYFGPDVQVIVHRTVDEISWALLHEDDGRARESWDNHPPVDKALEWIKDYNELPKPCERSC